MQTVYCEVSILLLCDALRALFSGVISLLNNWRDSGAILEKVCEYLYYNLKNKEAKDVPDMEIPPEMCLELLLAADYLNV